jgi:hypothetical protein
MITSSARESRKYHMSTREHSGKSSTKTRKKKEIYNAKKANCLERKRAYGKWAVNHNKRYMSEFDKVGPKMLKKDAIFSFGNVTRNYRFVSPQMKTLR